MSGNETLIAWLNDAYALEQQLITVLNDHSSDAANHPSIKQRIDQHLEETRQHAEIVKDCIERLGGSTSAAKAVMSRMSGLLAGISTSAAQDELVKNCLAEYSSEHLEIASYEAIVTACEALGHVDVADACRRILVDEERMAAWLEEKLPIVVQEHLTQGVGV